MKNIIVITGTPGTGKSFFSLKLSRKLGDAEIIKANSLVNEGKLFSSYADDGAKIVKMKQLRNEIEKRIKNSKKSNIIIEGHLLCDIKIKNAKAIVLREHPATLKKRLAKRGYSISKIRDNLVSESVDYCGTQAESNYAHCFEVLSSDRHAFVDLTKISQGKKIKKKSIDLLYELQDIIKEDIRFAI